MYSRKVVHCACSLLQLSVCPLNDMFWLCHRRSLREGRLQTESAFSEALSYGGEGSVSFTESRQCLWSVWGWWCSGVTVPPRPIYSSPCCSIWRLQIVFPVCNAPDFNFICPTTFLLQHNSPELTSKNIGWLLLRRKSVCSFPSCKIMCHLTVPRASSFPKSTHFTSCFPFMYAEKGVSVQSSYA